MTAFHLFVLGALLVACSSRATGRADAGAQLADAQADAGHASQTPDASAVAADTTPADAPGVEAGGPEAPRADTAGADSAAVVPACAATVNTGDACAESQSMHSCRALGFVCRCDCGPTCRWSCDFADWDEFLTIDPPAVTIDCTRPERVVEVRTRLRLRGVLDAALALELGRFSLELGAELGLERSCQLTGPVMPAEAGPVPAGTSHGFTATARGTCQVGATLADPCDACGRSATVVLGMRVKSGPLVAPWTSRGVGLQPHGTEITAICTGRP